MEEAIMGSIHPSYFAAPNSLAPFFSDSPGGARGRAGSGKRVKRLDDETFATLLTETTLGQLVTHQLDAADRTVFAPLLVDSDDSSFAKVDCSPVQVGEP